MKYINNKGIKKTKVATQKARGRHIIDACIGWHTTLLLCTLALVLLVGYSNTQNAQIDVTAPEPIVISNSNVEIVSSITTLQWTPSSDDIGKVRTTWTPDGSTTAPIVDLTPNTPSIITTDTTGNASNIVEVQATTPLFDTGLYLTQSTAPNAPTSNAIDADGDGLIDINSLERLNNVRYNLDVGAPTDDGRYKTSNTDSGTLCGATKNTKCTGYELMQSLDFASVSSYDSNTVNAAWRPNVSNPDDATNSGWSPIGIAVRPFNSVFEGNGYAISNLYTNGPGRIGLFGVAGRNAMIRNIGIIDSTFYGGTLNNDRVGGLVGDNNGTIIASYATGTGTVAGGDGNTDIVGGLVGVNSGTIIASYATGNVNGGSGNTDSVGGLVGLNIGTISFSYATGDVDGGAGDEDRVGGLVGQDNGATIIASYATGDVDGGAGTGDLVGALLGNTFDATDSGTSIVSYGPSTVTASYGFGTLTNVGTAGVDDSNDRPSGVSGVGSGPDGARQLTAPDTTTTTAVGVEWNTAGSDTEGAWNFGTATDTPTLRYANYDGSGTTYSCDTIPATVPDGSGGTTRVTCGTTLLPGQNSAVNLVDADGDGLIDINSLERLHNVRYNLDVGAPTDDGHYKTSSTDSGTLCGATKNTKCTGYELTRNLDFSSTSSYDSKTINATWRPQDGNGMMLLQSMAGVATNSGWEPINNFNTVFEGNDYTIKNIYSRHISQSSQRSRVGLFGSTSSNANIRNIGILNSSLYGSGAGRNNVGGLVGENSGTITASYATGDANGGGGDENHVGGLVGDNNGTITASYAIGNADGGDGTKIMSVVW